MKTKTTTHVVFQNGKSKFYKGKLKPLTLAKLDNKHGKVRAYVMSIDTRAPSRGFFNTYMIWG